MKIVKTGKNGIFYRKSAFCRLLLNETYRKVGENTQGRHMVRNASNSLYLSTDDGAEEGSANSDFLAEKDGRATM